jgi:ubiquitin
MGWDTAKAAVAALHKQEKQGRQRESKRSCLCRTGVLMGEWEVCARVSW